ncbi:SDR family oxidoreductase [Streptomyces sp. NPDC092369]|uniref:SDR family oxidoreductase n=1 Tax=Streptomyces sp. NPDC092369 TaxID=3366015 RepID=UPI0037F6948F
MNKILVTGASGSLGKLTLRHLLDRRPASGLVGLVRDPAKAQDLAELGIELRTGDYMDPASLRKAFTGVDKLMLVPTHAFTERKIAHANVIDAAVDAGVRHLVYAPIIRDHGSTFSMKEITAEDEFTQAKLAESGLAYTLAEHPPFLDVITPYMGATPYENGVRVPVGDGRFAAASRDDLAAAQAAILTEEGHEGKTYRLTGGPSVSFAEIAKILSDIHGSPVPYVPVSDEEYLDNMRAVGFPDFAVEFVLTWVHGMNAGEWEAKGSDLETLIGHSPTTTSEFLRSEYAAR